MQTVAIPFHVTCQHHQLSVPRFTTLPFPSLTGLDAKEELTVAC